MLPASILSRRPSFSGIERRVVQMPLRLQIRRDISGPWSLTGLPRQRAVEFDDLAAGLEYAERQCGSAPAIIELISDGIYVAVSQEEGWPHRLCRSPASRHLSAGGSGTLPAARLARLGDLLRRCALRCGIPCRRTTGHRPSRGSCVGRRFVAGA
jgi:hypothetical protein